jgi:hypothetical protein
MVTVNAGLWVHAMAVFSNGTAITEKTIQSGTLPERVKIH